MWPVSGIGAEPDQSAVARGLEVLLSSQGDRVEVEAVGIASGHHGARIAAAALVKAVVGFHPGLSTIRPTTLAHHRKGSCAYVPTPVIPVEHEGFEEEWAAGLLYDDLTARGAQLHAPGADRAAFPAQVTTGGDEPRGARARSFREGLLDYPSRPHSTDGRRTSSVE